MRTLIFLFAAACGTDSARPEPTGTVCPDPDPMTLGYTLADTPGCTGTPEQCNFGKTFMERYCTMCHAEALPLSKRNGASWGHDFDTFEHVLRAPTHIDREAGAGPLAINHFMPGDGTGGKCPSVPGGPLDEACPEPTDAERADLAVWLACEPARPHPF